MQSSVICISRSAVAGGETIGHQVAAALGFRYIDEEVIRLASEKARVDPQLVDQAEHRQPMLTRLIEALGAWPAAVASVEAGYYTAAPQTIGPPMQADLRSLIRLAIEDIADRGRVVIVAHAASFALAARPGILRVLVDAPPAVRAQRLVDMSLVSAADAAASIHDSDRERAEYLKRFYDVREELPMHYDLVVNTERLTVGEAVAAIVALAGAPAKG